MNYKLIIQYDGTDFHGWQIQDGSRTVQGELTRVLTLLNGDHVKVQGSGRTDAGVHAEGQVASVHLNRNIEPEKLIAAINGNLEADLRIINAEVVADDFHARFSVLDKTYVYRIVNSRVTSPFWARYTHREARALDLKKMKEAGHFFPGEHDWTAFSSAQTDAQSFVRNVTAVNINAAWDTRANANLIEIEVSANGFLRYMVRSIVGALIAVGLGELEPETIAQVIESGERPLAIVTAPACGLTLLRVRYD